MTDEMEVSFTRCVWSSVGHSYNRYLITAECSPCWRTHAVCLWTCCIKVIWTAQQEKRPWPLSLFLCLLLPGLSGLPPLPVSLCGFAQFNSSNGDGCRWREQVLNVRPKWKPLFQWDKSSWTPPVLFNTAMLTHKLYFRPHPYVNLDRSVFIHTHTHFMMFVDLMTPINQNILASLNVLLLLFWSKDTDSWRWAGDVLHSGSAIVVWMCNLVCWCCEGHKWSVSQHGRTNHLLLVVWNGYAMARISIHSLLFHNNSQSK